MADALSPVETLRAAADRVWTAPNPHPWAAVDPDAARALARWLESVANDHAAVESVDEARGECIVPTVVPGFKRQTSARHILPALAVARVLLEVPDA